jgi:hypothetical protein
MGPVMFMTEKRRARRLAALFTGLAALCFGTVARSDTAGKTPIGIKDTVMQDIGKARVFFGHKSVGVNILEGIDDIAKAQAFDWGGAVESLSPADFSGRGLLHYPLGANGDPKSKIDAFAAAMDGGLGGKAGIALFKFCYVDFDGDTDVDALFDRYVSVMDALAARYPGTVFMHATVPLVAKDVGLAQRIKNLAKPILGKKLNDYRDNARRESFSRLIRQTYGGKAPIFDIALYESTDPEGRRSFAKVGGEDCPVLFGGYTMDDGHLNAVGRRMVAARFLEDLAKAARSIATR